jgi:GPH family glycoside/pentoside/hexuronide:cation symporter
MRISSFTSPRAGRVLGSMTQAMGRRSSPNIPTAVSSVGLSPLQIGAYALAIWPLCIGQQALIFAGPYYSHVFVLPLALLGVAMTCGRVFDVCADITVASVSDRLRTPFGRRRPWVVVGMALFLPSLWFLFVPGGHFSMVRYGLGLIFFFGSWTMAFIPYLAQGTELATGHDEKSRVNIVQSAVMIAAFLGSYIIPFLCIDKSMQGFRNGLGDLIRGAGAWGASSGAWLHRPPPTGVNSYGEIMLVIVVVTSVVTPLILAGYMAFVPDRTAAQKAHGSLLAAFRNPVFLRFCGGHLMILSGFLGSFGVLSYMLAFAYGRPDLVLVLSLAHVITQMAVTPGWSWLFKKLERRTCIALAAVLQTASVLLFFFTPAHATAMLFVDYIAFGLGGQTLMMGCFLVAGDCADYSRWKTGKESRAVHISLVSLVIKAAYIVGSLLVVLLGLMGFNPALSHQTPGSLAALRYVGLLLPCGLMLGGAAIVWTYPVTRNRQRALQCRLDRREDAAAVVAVGGLPMVAESVAA